MKLQMLFRLVCSIIGFILTDYTVAQVTIGSTREPIPGALLQLTEGEKTTKGLSLPRVNLTNLEPTTGSELSQSIGGTGDYPMDESIGLMVYNTQQNYKDENIIRKGIYTWSGEEWIPMRSPYIAEEVSIYTDTRNPGNPEIYHYRSFGDAGVWMLENMRATEYDDDSSTSPLIVYDGSSVNAGTVTTKYMFAYPNSSNAAWTTIPTTWTKRQGLLYNWRAATNNYSPGTMDQGQNTTAAPSGNEVEKIGPNGPDANGNKYVQGICPKGWHVPSDREWNKLEEEVYHNAHIYSSYTKDHEGSLGFNPNTWTQTIALTVNERGSSATKGHGYAMTAPYMVRGASNEIKGASLAAEDGGFNALPTGYISTTTVSVYGVNPLFWTSSSHSASGGWIRYMRNGDSKVHRNAAYRNELYSVRCKMND